MWRQNQGVFCCGQGFFGRIFLVRANLCEGGFSGDINCASVVKYASYDALHAEDTRGVEVGGVAICGGSLGISRAERVGCVPVGGVCGNEVGRWGEEISFNRIEFSSEDRVPIL